MIAESRSFSDVQARLAALRDPGAAEGHGAPGGATPEQLDAMRETMEILADPEMAVRVRAGRQALAAADVVELEELSADPPPTPARWRVALCGPAARQLAQMGQPSVLAVHEMLAALATGPAEHSSALGMGLVGVWSARGASHRILYTIQEGHRLLNVLTIDDSPRPPRR